MERNFTSILMHQRRLLSATRELSLDDLKSAAAKLDNVIQEREKEEREQIEQEQRKQALIKKALAELEQNGVSPEEAIEILHSKGLKGKQKRGPKAAKEPKYAFYVDGERRTWTGVGRMPFALQEMLDQGKSLDDFLI